MNAPESATPRTRGASGRFGLRAAAAASAMALIVSIVPGATQAMAARQVAPAADPDAVAFTLEGCRNDGTVNLPNGSGQFVCPDGVYTSGNLGKGWAELDLVPYRLTARAGNAAPTGQTYTIAYAVDREQTGAAGYDVLSPALVNSALSVGTCPAPVVGSEAFEVPGIGGIDKTLYRTLTITQQRNSTCVYDFYARLALGSHLFPGSSLHANLALVDGGDLDTGGIGARDVSIPVNEVEPQSIDKDMTGSQGSDHTWNVTKEVAPASLSLTDTCDVTGDYASVSVDETITWTKNAAIPGAATLTTNVYATNPASRAISVTVSDVMYAGNDDSVAIDDTTFATVVVPARTRLLIGTHIFVWTNPTTTQVNDRATAIYVDVATGVTIPGDEEATASATIQDDGPVSNSSAIVDDTQSISGSGLSFSIDAVEGATGSFSGYTLGTQTTGPVSWASDSQQDSGSVTFRKTVYAAKGTVEPAGLLADEAGITGSDGFATQASASASINADARARLSLEKTIPAGIITRGTESQQFDFAVVTGDDTAATPSVTFEAGETAKVTQVNDLVPGVYMVSEGPAAGWLPQSSQTVDLTGSLCVGSVSFANLPEPADVEAVKVTVPAGFESGWSMGLYRGDDTTPLSEGVTDDSGVIDFGSLDVEGAYTIRETAQTGWSGQAGEGCTFEVDLPADGGSTFTCTYTNTFEPQVRLDKTGDELSKVGDDVNYSLTLANTSPTGATSGTPDLDCRVVDSPISLDETVTLGADDSRTWGPLSFTIPSGSDPYVNEASAECTFPGSTEVVASAQADWSTELFQPEVTVTKAADRSYAQVGEKVTYTVTITNTGSSDSPALVPDDTNPVSDPLVSGLTLPSTCSSLEVGDSCEFTYDYVVKEADSVIPNTVSVLFHPDGFPNDVTDSASASVTVIRPSFTVTKTCSTPNFPAGTTAIFIVDVVNTGDASLRIALDDSTSGNGNPFSPYPLTGANTTATTTSDITNADITFAGGTASFRLDPGKKAQLEISVSSANVAITNVIAATSALTSTYQGTSYDRTLTAQDVCVDAPPDGATRTIGFWRTHLSFLRQVLNTQQLPAGAVTGSNPLGVANDAQGTFIGGTLKLSSSGSIFRLRSVADVMGVQWASTAQNSTGSKRSTLCQARITLATQLLGAILNQSFANAKPLPTVGTIDLITAGLQAMDTRDPRAIRNVAALLDAYNNSGDETTILIEDALTIGKADPVAARAMARLVARDCKSPATNRAQGAHRASQGTRSLRAPREGNSHDRREPAHRGPARGSVRG